MKIESVKLTTLSEDPHNVRLHSKRNMDSIRASLTAFGQQKPLVITQDGTIVAGNGTYAAALSLEWQTIDVVRIPKDWSPEQITSYAIADNRTSELGEWDYGVLLDTLGNLDDDLVVAAGWDESGLKFLLEPPVKEQPQPAPSNAGETDTYADNLEKYEQSETRSVLFDLTLSEYMRATSQLDTAREAYNVTTNSEAVKILLNKYLEE